MPAIKHFQEYQYLFSSSNISHFEAWMVEGSFECPHALLDYSINNLFYLDNAF